MMNRNSHFGWGLHCRRRRRSAVQAEESLTANPAHCLNCTQLLVFHASRFVLADVTVHKVCNTRKGRGVSQKYPPRSLDGTCRCFSIRLESAFGCTAPGRSSTLVNPLTSSVERNVHFGGRVVSHGAKIRKSVDDHAGRVTP